MGSPNFDPTRPALKHQISSALGLAQNALVEAKQGHRGGMNEGVWIIRDQSQSYVMKLVKGSNAFGMPTEAEKLIKLRCEHPNIINDASLAFPVKIFWCAAPGVGRRYELIVMQQVPGTLLSELIANMLGVSRGDNLGKVTQVFEHLGRFLADFQMRYGNKQHNDFQPSNIFYDPAIGKFTLIDVSDIGLKTATAEADSDRFTASLSLLSKCYGQNFYHEGKRAFEAGYRARRNGHHGGA